MLLTIEENATLGVLEVSPVCRQCQIGRRVLGLHAPGQPIPHQPGDRRREVEEQRLIAGARHVEID
jgi:hypothetical protein